MAGSRTAGPLGTDNNSPAIDEGTLARTNTPLAGPVGADKTTAGASTGVAAAPAQTDPEIEALNLANKARKAAYELKKAHPSVKFTSGRRTKEDQARAMASNVVENRKWIEETYVASALRTKCQQWVDDNPEKKTQTEIAQGLVSIFNESNDTELGKLSKHLSGEAFDVQPVEENAEAIKSTIRGLPGLGKFLDKEGGLVRWHAQF